MVGDLDSGPGLDIVEIPDEVRSGSYRSCTAMSIEIICTGIKING